MIELTTPLFLSAMTKTTPGKMDLYSTLEFRNYLNLFSMQRPIQTNM